MTLAGARTGNMTTPVAQLRATYHFRVNNLLVRPDLLGTSYELADEPGRIVLTLPIGGETARTATGESVHALFPIDEPPLRQIGGLVTSSVSAEPSSDLVRVELVRAQVYVASDLSAAAWESDSGYREEAFEGPASHLLWDGLASAQVAVGGFLEWVRVAGQQHWLGPAAREPEPTGPADLVDTEAWALLPITIDTDRVIFRRVADSQVLDEASINSLADRSRLASPTLATRLLADAAHFAFEVDPPDTDRSILVAAIACEVGIKDVLRATATGSSSDLLDLLLSNPRDWSMAAAAIWHKPAKVVLGRSLLESDKPLYRELELLFRRRNRIAHRGESFSKEEARSCVDAAARALRWLRSP